MARALDTKLYLDMVCDLLHQGQTQVAVPVSGSSMAPFLHDGDTVYLDPLPQKLRRGDIVLYSRPNGDYVLHRIHHIQPDGCPVLVGDAQQLLEHLSSAACVHGIVTRALHQGKSVTQRSLRWWAYRHLWLWALPWRQRLMSMRR